jgi:tetratricopeptide (TPR) repeat protein
MPSNTAHKSHSSTLAIGLAALLCLVGSAFVSARAVESRPQLPTDFADQDMEFQGRKLRGWALGTEGLLADWYWMRSLQYIGDKIVKSEAEFINVEDLRPLNPRLLYPLLDNATDLDPRFMAAFSYGSIVLPAIDPEHAIALTKKGIDANPESWRLYQYLGYIYWRQKRFEEAADTYDRGARIAGAPQFMRQMVATMKTQGGSRETAREIYVQMRDEAEDKQSRENAELRLLELDALDELDAINAALKAAAERSGTCPASLRQIIPALREAKLPGGRNFRLDANGDLADPLGFPYRLLPEDCRAQLNPDTKIPKQLN